MREEVERRKKEGRKHEKRKEGAISIMYGNDVYKGTSQSWLNFPISITFKQQKVENVGHLAGFYEYIMS